MNIQSASIVVPTVSCLNSCKFCVSRMHENDYVNKFDIFQITKRIKWAIANNITSCILTGTGEALQNKSFLNKLLQIFIKMDHPFPNMELQTSGVLLNQWDEFTIEPFKGQGEYSNLKLLKQLGINTISLSVSDPFNDDNNMDIIGVPEKLRFKLVEIINLLKENGFNIRLSLNMTKVFNNYTSNQILNRCKELKADQITFRKMYYADDNSEQSEWVKNNSCDKQIITDLNLLITGATYMKGHQPGIGTPLYRLPFGAMAYSVMGMSTVIDDNCMNKDEKDKLKYVILREDGKLYTMWDDKGSLIF